MSATWSSGLNNFQTSNAGAIDAGLIAAAQVLVNEVRRRLRGGYTSGAYFTGVSMNSVTRSDPMTEDGVRVIRVGGKPSYLLFWELGHQNLFTDRYERQERWRPALAESRNAIAQAFAATYKRFMGSA